MPLDQPPLGGGAPAPELHTRVDFVSFRSQGIGRCCLGGGFANLRINIIVQGLPRKGSIGLASGEFPLTNFGDENENENEMRKRPD
jgi:hypothetical protein